MRFLLKQTLISPVGDSDAWLTTQLQMSKTTGIAFSTSSVLLYIHCNQSPWQLILATISGLVIWCMILFSFYVTLPFINNAFTNDDVIWSCLCDEYMHVEVSLVPRSSRLQFLIVCSKLEPGVIKNWRWGYQKLEAGLSKTGGGAIKNLRQEGLGTRLRWSCMLL